MCVDLDVGVGWLVCGMDWYDTRGIWDGTGGWVLYVYALHCLELSLGYRIGMEDSRRETGVGPRFNNQGLTDLLGHKPLRSHDVSHTFVFVLSFLVHGSIFQFSSRYFIFSVSDGRGNSSSPIHLKWSVHRTTSETFVQQLDSKEFIKN